MKRRTQSNCSICYTLDIFGDRWTLLIIRDILLCRKRHFREFSASGEGIAPNILADRLKMLVEECIITRHEDEDRGNQIVYLPTSKAHALMPLIKAMTNWALAFGPDELQCPPALRSRVGELLLQP